MKSKKKYTLLYEDSAGRHYMDTQTFEEVTKARRKKKEAFYDGEGNPIPERIVRLYVQAHFVQMEPQEVDSIRKYFYFY